MKNFYQLLLSAMLMTASSAVFSQTPAHSSYPAANAVIYLDFDGHYLTGTSWNGNGPITLGASNLNNTQITEVFNRIAEDYRPFNINVTTDSTKYWSAPANMRMRVLFTITSSWYGSAGGVAYVGSFKWSDNTPCFVFTALLNYNVKYISEAGAHEAGHTLGLRHQSAYDANCVKTAEYNSGTGSGEIAWAPIMGVGYYRNYTVWHNGPNPYGCNSTQNDLDIITSTYNGFGYRNDDHANVIAAASVVSFSNNQFIVSGVVEKTDDKDIFRIVLNTTGQMQLNAIPYNVGTGNIGSDLDMQVQLTDASLQVLETYNPGTLLSSIADTILNAGTYFLIVDGMSNQYASEYGSLGSYSIQGTFVPAAPLPLRRLELNGIIVNGIHKLKWLIDADEEVTEQVLQVSSNGRDFETVTQVSSAARTFQYAPFHSGNLQYRVSVRFDNGRHYYSNILILKNTNAIAKPQLVSNTVSGSLSVISPAHFNYSIFDATGRFMAKGNLHQGNNNVPISMINTGTYFIHFFNGDQKFSELFIKQ